MTQKHKLSLSLSAFNTVRFNVNAAFKMQPKQITLEVQGKSVIHLTSLRNYIASLKQGHNEQ